MKKLDKVDKKIIQILQKNARTPLKEIAAQVFLSSPSVSARIEKLEHEGVIIGYTARVNPLYLNYHIKAFINLEVKPEDKSEFYPFIEKIPNVIQCDCVTGDYSMLIQAAYRRPEELDHLVNELQKFGRTKTEIAFSTPIEHRPIPVKTESDDEEDKKED